MSEDKIPIPAVYDKDYIINLITSTYKPARQLEGADFLNNQDLLELVSNIAVVPSEELYQLMIDLGFKNQVFDNKLYWLIAS